MKTIAQRISIEKLEKATRILKAVAHPTRVAIIDLLDQCENLCVGDLQEKLGVEQATLSHHLITMRDKGILQTERQGKFIYYSLADKTITKIIQCINDCEKF